MNQTLPEDDLLQAHIDGELDPVSAADFDRRLAADPVLRARYESLLVLRSLIRSIPEAEAPVERLRQRMSGAIVQDTKSRRSWRALAAAALIGAVFGGAVTLGLLHSDMGRETSSFVVTNHIRGLLAPQPFDIASSDRHTIKPWFTSRLPESPQVIDLTADGFTLLGGRVDVVGEQPIATVIYRHGGHTISLSAFRGQRVVADGNTAGYAVRAWRDGDFTYVAVADLPDADLDRFQRAFLAAIALKE